MAEVVDTDPDAAECEMEDCTAAPVATVEWTHGAVTYTKAYCKPHGYGLAPDAEVW